MTSISIGDTRNVDGASADLNNQWVRFLPLAFWFLALVAGGYQALATRNGISNDGISYLDMGDAIARGQWSALLNGYWSPLYPILIAFALAIVRPAPWNEFATVHLVNFAVYVAALASFEFFLRSLLDTTRFSGPPQWLSKVIGYSLFIWSSLELIGNSGASPDMTVSAFVFLAAGLFVKIAAGRTESWLFLLLGAVLGLGYWAKAPLFPLAFVFFGLALFSAAGLRKSIPRVAIAILAFTVVASPYLLSLSRAKGRLTFGDSGRLNYAWYVDSATYRHWQGGDLGPASEVAPHWSRRGVSSGIPLHPTRKILDTPPVYEFEGPIQGTYPVWYDPSYWDDGVKAPFDLRQQFRKITVNVKFMYSLLLNLHVVQLYRENQLYKLFSPLVLIIWLAWVFIRKGLAWSRPALLLLCFAAAALAMYSLVYCEPRHLAPFVVLLFLSLFALLRPATQDSSLIARATLSAIIIGFGLTVGSGIVSAQPPKSDEWAAASALHDLGVVPGTEVASVEYSNHANVKWARLARARIVAEIYTDAFAPRGYFWRLSPEAQARALDAFRQAHAQFAIASDLPVEMTPPSGWQRAGTTKYIVYRLR